MKQTKEQIIDEIAIKRIGHIYPIDGITLEAMETYASQVLAEREANNGWVSVEDGLPETQGDSKEYLCRAIKSTNEQHEDYVVCWFDENEFHISHGNLRKYNDNADLMHITHWQPINLVVTPTTK